MDLTSTSNIASRFDDIYDSTNKAVLAFITAKCGNTADIEDIFQDTYIELYKVLIKRGADYIANEQAFVMRIAKRKVAKYYTLLERLRNFKSLDAVNGDGDNIDYEDTFFSLEDSVVNHAMFEEARKFIQSKPEVVKKVFALFYDVGLTIPEIAKALSMGESNVKQKLYRTLKELRKLLNGG